MSPMDAVRAALAELPASCRYHGDNVEDTHHLRYGPPPHACCETGRPALLRRLAEDELRGLAAEWKAARDAQVGFVAAMSELSSRPGISRAELDEIKAGVLRLGGLGYEEEGE